MSDKQSTEEQLMAFFKQSGANDDQAGTMAKQMIRRAKQKAEKENCSETEAMHKLLKLFVEARHY